MRRPIEEAILELPEEEREAILGFPEEEREIVLLLIQAARHEIHLDYKRAHSLYRPFLLYIERNLTRPRLRVTAARKAAKLTNSGTYSPEFKRIVGMSPKEYIRHHRIELAKRIIRHTTKAEKYVIAYAVGYRDQSLFTRTYSRHEGHAPGQEPKADANETILLLEKLRQARSQWEETPDPKIARNTAEISVSVNSHENNLTRFWEDIRHLDRERVQEYIYRNAYSLEMHHFNFLLEKSKLEGRRRRERGEELAQVALDCLRILEFTKRREFLGSKTLGYAILANARRFQGDVSGAKEAFREVDRLMPKDPEPILYLQVSFFRAYLLWWQRDVGSAIKLVEEILPEIRECASHELLARTLQLAGEIYECNGNSERALPLFEEAVGFSQFVDDPYVTIGGYYNLSYLNAKLSNVERATQLFEIVRKLHAETGLDGSSVYVTLLEASIHQANGELRAAESAFLEAREGFERLGLPIYVALTSLELALLYLDLEEPSRAFSMATRAIDCVSQYSFHKEATAALAILQEVSQSNISRATVRQALHHIELVRKDPTSELTAVEQA